MVRCFAAALVAAVCVTALPADARSCVVRVGQAVMLRSSDFDPDVLVWDSRQRAIDYVGGNIKNATDVINHTLLSQPGTRAVVVACVPASSKPRYTDAVLDTVGIKVTTGPHRGRYGWVSSDDVHPAAAAKAAAR